MKKRIEKLLGWAALLAVALIYVTVALQAQDRPLPSEIEATRAEVGDTSAAVRAHADSVAGDSAQAAEARAKAAAADSAAAAVSAHEAAIGHVDTSFVRTTAGDSGQAAEARAKAAAGDSALAALTQARGEMPDSALAAFVLEIVKYIRIAGNDSTVIDSMLHLLNGLRVTGYARFDSILNGALHLPTTAGDSGKVVYSLGNGRWSYKTDDVDTSGVAGQIDSLAEASADQDSIITAKAQADSTFLDSLARAESGGVGGMPTITISAPTGDSTDADMISDSLAVLAAAGGGLLYLRAGNYVFGRLDSLICPTAHTGKIIVSGEPGRVIWRKAQSTTATDSLFFLYNKASNIWHDVEFEYIDFRGGGVADSIYGIARLDSAGNDNIVFRECTIDSFLCALGGNYNGAIMFKTSVSATGWLFERCAFVNNRMLWLDMGEVLVRDSRWGGAWHNPAISRTAGARITISDCRFGTVGDSLSVNYQYPTLANTSTGVYRNDIFWRFDDVTMLTKGSFFWYHDVPVKADKLTLAGTIKMFTADSSDQSVYKNLTIRANALVNLQNEAKLLNVTADRTTGNPVVQISQTADYSVISNATFTDVSGTAITVDVNSIGNYIHGVTFSGVGGTIANSGTITVADTLTLR